jgi:hypothetical protein
MGALRFLLSVRRHIVVAAVLVTVLSTGVAYAYFSTTLASGSSAQAVAGALPPASTPTAAVSGGSVTLSWPQSTVAGQRLGSYTGGGYSVKRYPAAGGAGATVSGSCATTITGSGSTLSCLAGAEPQGSWVYTVTPVLNAWMGIESAKSNSATVSTLTLTAPANGTSTSSNRPTFSGATTSSSAVTLNIYAGSGVSGSPVQTLATTPSAGNWSVEATTALTPDGTYTAQATQDSGSSGTSTFAVDTISSTDALSLAPGASGAFVNAGGTIVYYKANASGSFKLIDRVSDSGSGPASASFPAIATSGWAHGAETVSSGSGSLPTVAYTSGTFSWTASPGTPAGYNVSSNDAAGNTSSGAGLVFTSDTSAPTGGGLSVNGTAATGSDPVSYTSSTGFSIGARTDYAELQSGTQSGLASSSLTLQSETLSNGVCGTPGSGGPFASATAITGTTQPSGIASGFCYLYTLTGSDNVGNVASVTTTVIVDTSKPSTPSLSFSGLSSNAYYASANNTLYFRPAAGGTYTLAATSTAPSGIAAYTFSSLAGNGFTGSQAGGQVAYTFGASASQPASPPSVSATSKSANASASASYNLIADTTAPAGGALSVNGTAASGSGSSSTTSNPAFTIGARSDYGEAQSATQAGLASSTLTVQSEALTSGACGAPGSAGPFASATAITGTTQPSGIASGFCYLYTLTGKDNVGNPASISTTVSVASLTISGAVRDGGNQKFHFTGSGAAAGTTITVTICAVNSFPCAAPAAGTSTVVPTTAGVWTSAQDDKNLTAATTYYAQAVQGTAISAVLAFTTGP